MSNTVIIIGAGLAGSEAALQLAGRGVHVRLFEMRPQRATPVHETDHCAELVCSNSLKSMKPESAAGMLKGELDTLGSYVMRTARKHGVAAGGALAVDRSAFSRDITAQIEGHPLIDLVRGEIQNIEDVSQNAEAVILATGPLTSDALAASLTTVTGSSHLAFYDAAAPIVMADSLDMNRLFRQSRYEDGGQGDYLNAPFSREEYDTFIEELTSADRVILRDFETRDLFQACQPIEELARKGRDAPRFGPLKPVGLTDPRTDRRPWAALQLRAEDAHGSSYNLVGFQTNLTFSEQRRVFRLIPGLENAEFTRYGVMHRNTFIDAPRLLDAHLQLAVPQKANISTPLFVAGQLAGTEGYCEAIRSGLHVALSVYGKVHAKAVPPVPEDMAFGALLSYATNPETKDYQPMHVNFGIMKPLETHIRNKKDRYAAYAQRGARALARYVEDLACQGILSPSLGTPLSEEGSRDE